MEWFGLPYAASPWPVQVLVNLAFAGLVWGTVWWFVTRQAKSTGTGWSSHVWPAIKDCPICVTLQRLGVYALALGTAFIAFGGFK